MFHRVRRSLASRSNPWTSLALAFVLFGAPTSASAQGASAPPPDVVRTSDGGMVRGTIVELVPSGPVTIQLVTGEVRTIARADIAYAGPADAASPAAAPTPAAVVAPAPAAAPTPAPAADDSVGVSVVPDEDDERELRVHVVTGEGTMSLTYAGSNPGQAFVRAYEFGDSCVMPCTLQVSRGGRRFAISYDDREPIVSERMIHVDDSLTLRGTYDDAGPRRKRRVRWGVGMLAAGGAVAITGLILWVPAMECGIESEDPDECMSTAPSIAMGLVGTTAAIAGLITLLTGTGAHDSANLEPFTVRF